MHKPFKAIIIGATSGIGCEVAIHLSRHGVVLGLAGRRTEKLETLREELGAERVHITELDVTRESATDALDGLISAMGAPDLLLYASIGGVWYVILLARWVLVALLVWLLRGYYALGGKL